MMTDTIYFKFRGHDHKAYVHVHSDSWTVFLNDEEILNIFGGSVEYDQDKKPVKFRKTEAPDVKEFHKAIAQQLK